MTDRKREPANDREDIAELEPGSKRGKGGQAAHGGDQAGPSSHQAGKPQSPQTGDPKSDDRNQGG